MTALPNEATIAQIDAAQPRASTWLSANAGSGKTRVLTDRVARLLLEEVDPQNILCLTYTKAAASEMQNRLLKRLGAWAMKPDVELKEELAELGAAVGADASYYKNARRLFAKAIETPGGLRIQTIHSFCASLLRRFPLEAGVTPQFTELDDRTSAQLREQVTDDLSSSDEAQLLLDMISHLGGNDFEQFTASIVSNKAKFAKDLTREDVCKAFGIPDDLTQDKLLAEVFIGGEAELVAEMLPIAAAGSANDVKAHAKLEKFNGPGLSSLPVLESVFLTGSGAKEPFTAKLSSYVTAKTRDNLAHLAPQIEALILRIEAARPRRIALAAAQSTLALHAFARAFLARYDATKQAHGWLDFDDLILKTKALLTNPQVAEWVLYRLDGGIDHILVDEAQDTSPEQWAVIEELAREITSGQGAQGEKPRTIFVVGDKKQSIYSFQGADAAEFGRMRNVFQEKLSLYEEPLHTRNLAYSFRSSPAILSMVDAVFEQRGDAGFGAEEAHIAFHSTMPGRVDIWPQIEKEKKDDDLPWFEPLDILTPDDPISILSKTIADNIKQMIDSKTLIPTKLENGTWQARPVHEGDFLILLQRRKELFHEIIRACKLVGLDVAGADRLRIGEQIAVKDITAFLKFLALQEDDLSLAAALRSPLFGWSEQDLFTLASKRKGYLWEALRSETETHSETLAILNDMRRVTDFLRPYDLIERLLTRHKTRQKILARLGYEAEDALDAFLAQALAYERSSVPSLTGFLSWLESDDPEIKRQTEAGGKRIRVMTVHGSKGLEAPIVIMPETADRSNTFNGQIVASGDTAFYKQSKDETPAALQSAVEEKLAAQEAERQRLLYVSMTRAEKWLIIAAAGEVKNGKSWYHSISEAAKKLPFAAHQNSDQVIQRLETGDWAALSETESSPAQDQTFTLDPHFAHAAPAGAPQPQTISASKLPGAKALGSADGLDEATAMRYGTKVHLLLEHLPNVAPEARRPLAETLLAHIEAPEENEAAYAEVETVLANGTLAHLFMPDVLSEVSLTAPSSTLGKRLHGIVDKLVVGEARVLAVDFKTNATLPARPEDTPIGILRQMGAYAEALALIYPNHKIETAILWTKTPELMALPHDLVINAFQSATYLDDLPPDT
ncbi:double-strand break repair helicase AddA [Lentibacter sp. XHP0401]|uniref:double-strand break repair helicase AddA n=1 Tax=Lentibacter sp. XHP0401 TaxID=2984334 RepID=UPI0021E86DEF|nr:double-strand break repair helicase AddA [Lentibacter sp. XHP0401]MCV2892638.1 double-strand break repair helicase AddA [Lentibacter sp. XHP0401]